jgi:hypothetical protein
LAGKVHICDLEVEGFFFLGCDDLVLLLVLLDKLADILLVRNLGCFRDNVFMDILVLIGFAIVDRLDSKH